MARTDEFNSLTKEEQLEMMRDYGGIGNPNSAFSIEERYPCIADDEEIMKKEVFSEKVSDRTTGKLAEENAAGQDSTIQPAPDQEPQPKPDTPSEGRQPPVHRISSKQRRFSLDEYASVFLPLPKIDHPKPVFISESLRDQLDKVARRLGVKRMSASGIVENMVRHHLSIYGEDIKQWFKL